MSDGDALAARVTNPRAATLLVDPARRRFLDPFLDRDCTVAQAARELGEDKNAVLYRVRQMKRLGLVHVVREEPRRGRSVKVYRSVAARLFVPYAATPAADLLEVLLTERAATERVLQTASLRVMRAAHGDEHWGMLLYRSGEGVYAYDAVNARRPWHALDEDGPAVLDYTLCTRPLSRERAKALQRALHDVLVAHTGGPDEPGGTRYLIRVALAPQTEGDA